MLGKLLLVVLSAISYVSSGQTEQPDKPNIIVILADDFGVGDIKAHYPDNKIPTPAFDQLSAEGMRFTDAHSGSAVCTPTRYGLLTGRYAWRSKLQEWVMAAWDAPLIDEEIQTLPEMLKEKGYATALIGKWHLGMEWPGRSAEALKQPISNGPLQHGFDYYFGTDVPNFPPFTWIENDRVALAPTESFDRDNYPAYMHQGYGQTPAPIAPGWDFSDILPELTRRCVSYIEQRSRRQQPFFMLFSMTSPHEPVAPSDKFLGKSGIAPIADFVMETDWSAGQVIQAVEKAGISDNTIIIFTADNGHSHYTGWEELVAAGHLPSGEFRGHKADIWEGGHRVPFIIKWPGKVKPNSKNDQLICLNDIYMTLAQYLKVKLSKETAVDSYSFLSSLADPGRPVREQVVHHSVHGEFSLRRGPWKIVFLAPTGNRNSSRGQSCITELYHLEKDPAEKDNIVAEHPQLVAELTEELDKIVSSGASRPGARSRNDVPVSFRTIQSARGERWR